MLSISWCSRLARGAALLAAAAAVLFLPPAAEAMIVNAGCLAEEAPPQGLNCTSNDLTFILVGLGTQTDGCVDEGFGHCTPVGDPDPDPAGEPCTISPDSCDDSPVEEECRALDEVSIFMRAVVQNSTAQTRYDVGLWFATDGDPQVCSGKVCSTTLLACFTDAQCPGGETCGSRSCAVNADCPLPQVCNPSDGARGGECGREMLHPTRVCNGGANNGFPCNFDVDCPSGLCEVPGHCSVTTSQRCFAVGGPPCPGVQTCIVPANFCPPLDLIGNDPTPPATPPAGPANGPYVVAESTAAVFDRCGDIRAQGNSGCDEDGNGLWDDTVLDFDEAVTIPCSDVDDDGFVNIPTCATWGNNEGDVAMGECEADCSPPGGEVCADAGQPCDADNQCDADCLPRGVCVSGASTGLSCLTDVDCGGVLGSCSGNSFAVDTCDSEFEVFHNNPAKCRCENVNSNIPNPNLNLTCTLPNRCTITGNSCTVTADCTGGVLDVCVSQPSTVPPDSEVLFHVAYTNPVVCTPDVNTPERFQCGTASFIRFDVDDQLPAIDPDNGTFLDSPPNETQDITPTFPSNPAVTAEEVQWIPNSAVGTPGIIGAGRSGTLEVSYRLGADDGDTVNLRARTFWSNESDFDPGFYQLLQAICPINVDLDWASVASPRAYELGGRVVFEWRTTTEVQTRGFEVYRLDRGADRRLPLADGLVLSPMIAEGSVYRVLDPQGRPGERVEYLLVEEDLYGHRRVLGPYAVTVGAAPPARAKADDLGLGARPVLPSLAELRRLETSLAEAEAAQATTATPAAGGGALKATVEATGIYRVGADQLAAAWGISSSQAQAAIASGRLLLTNRGSEVAWSPAGDANAFFFYGQAAEDPFSRFNVYWISAERGTLAAAVSGGAPAPQPGLAFAESLRLETQSFAATNAAKQPDVDYWFWDGILAPATKTLDVTVPDAVGGAAAELTARFYGATDYPQAQEHTAIVRVNGVDVGQTSWENIRFHEATFAVPAGVLVAGANQIEVSGVLGGAPVSGFFIDRFTLSYPRLYRALGDALAFGADGHAVVTVEGFSSPAIAVFEVVDPLAPRVVTDLTVDADGSGGFRASFQPTSADATYLATTLAAMRQPAALWADTPSDLAGSSGAEWVVVAPAQLMAGAQSLALYRQQRFSTMAVNLEDVYDEFNDGLASPHALRDFIVHAATHWPQPPQYVVFAGAGSYDYKDYQGLGGNLVPPLMVDTPSGLFASDIAYGDVAGNDGVPEVAIGRIPALTQAELTKYLNKVKAVERSGGPDWRGSALMVADNPDSGGDFSFDSDSVASFLPGSYVVDKAYLEQLPAAEVRQQTIDAFNRGVGFVNYVGHGGVTQFADEALLTVADAALLTNGRRPAVAASLTCVAGRFEFPGMQSLAEALVLANGGAVAMWAPSGLSYSVDAARLNRAFVDAAFDSGATVGSGVREALAAYQEEGFSRHLLYIYNVFGDPAVRAR